MLFLELGASAGDAVWASSPWWAWPSWCRTRLTRLGLGVAGSIFLFYLAYRMLEGMEMPGDGQGVGHELPQRFRHRGHHIVRQSRSRSLSGWASGRRPSWCWSRPRQTIDYVIFFIAYMIGSCLMGDGNGGTGGVRSPVRQRPPVPGHQHHLGIFMLYLATSLLWNTDRQSLMLLWSDILRPLRGHPGRPIILPRYDGLQELSSAVI